MDMELKDSESALILDRDGSFRFMIPEMDDETNAEQSELVIMLLAIMFKLDDKEFKQFLGRKMEEHIHARIADMRE